MTEGIVKNKAFRLSLLGGLIFLNTCSLFNNDNSSSTGNNLDTAFGTGGIVTTNIGRSNGFDSANSVAIQTDGKIVAAGSMYNGSEDVLALARFNTDGSLDTTFGTGGYAVTDTGPWASYSYAYARSVAVQSNGKIVVAGYSAYNFVLVRYNPDGSLDTTFGTDGLVMNPEVNYFIFSMGLQSNGKIVTAGETQIGANMVFALKRFNSDGSLDPAFGLGGLVTTTIGTDSSANLVSILSDGKIIAAGYSDSSFVMVKYSTDGSLDTTFGIGGVVTISQISYYGGLAIQLDGKIVVAGDSNSDSFLIRYEVDGSLDTTFGTGGMVTNSGFIFSINSIAFQSDGKIVAAGGSGQDFRVARYNVDGSLDTTFGTGGLVTNDIGGDYDTAESLAIQIDGKIVVVGYALNNSKHVFPLVRYNTEGSLDTTFGANGMIITTIPAGNDFVRSVAIQSDGKIVAGGYSWNGMYNTFALARYSTDGSLDTTFGSGGMVTTDIGGDDSRVQSVAIQSDGKIIAAGYAVIPTRAYDFTLVRYNSDGSLDSNFGAGGVVTTDIGTFGYDYAQSVAIQSDGKIVAAGYSSTWDGKNSTFALVRYNNDGSLDTTFNSTGIVTQIWFLGSTSFIYSVAIQPDGKIIIAGSALGDPLLFLMRFNNDGSVDSAFATGGLLVVAPIGQSASASSVTVQSDGKIVAVGWASNFTNTKIALVRFNIDGSPDTTFGTDGIVTNAIGKNSSANSVAIQSDGKIVVAGSTNNGQKSDFALVRYNPDGSLDDMFNSDGIVKTSIGPGDDMANSIVVQSDGKIIAAGSTYNGTNTDFALVRYLP